MPFIDAPAATAALTANGSADGYVTVADNTKFYPGAFVWLHGTATEPKQYIVTDLVGATKIGIREVLEKGNGPRYGRTPATQWTTADAARIDQEPSTVRVELSNVVKLPVP